MHDQCNDRPMRDLRATIPKTVDICHNRHQKSWVCNMYLSNACLQCLGGHP